MPSPLASKEVPVKALRNKRGDFTLNSAFMLLLVSMLIMLSLSVLGVASTSLQLRSAANELLRYTELRGRVDSAVWAEARRLEQVSGIDFDCRIDADYLPGTDKVQFGDPISVRLSTDRAFGIGGILSVPIQINALASGRSELYWKQR